MKIKWKARTANIYYSLKKLDYEEEVRDGKVPGVSREERNRRWGEVLHFVLS